MSEQTLSTSPSFASGRAQLAASSARRKRNKNIEAALAHVILIAFVIFALFPVVWIVSASFKPREEVFSTEINIIPQTITTANYAYVFNYKGNQDKNLFIVWLGNSVFYALNTTVIGVFFAVGAAYGLSRYKFFGRRPILIAFLVTQMFPGAILIVPLYNILNNLHLLNNAIGLVLAYSTTALPFSVWMLKGFMDTLPFDLEEAALVDGAGPFRTFFRIILPLAIPGIAVVTFYNFIAAWNEYLLAVTFMTGDDKKTLAVGMNNFISQFAAEWQYMAAMSVIITIPVMIGFFLAQRYLISGLTAGAVKG